ncbi:hypothetical protein HK405_011826, partial [Cladochytrium tenue]
MAAAAPASSQRLVLNVDRASIARLAAAAAVTDAAQAPSHHHPLLAAIAAFSPLSLQPPPPPQPPTSLRWVSLRTHRPPPLADADADAADAHSTTVCYDSATILKALPFDSKKSDRDDADADDGDEDDAPDDDYLAALAPLLRSIAAVASPSHPLVDLT